MSCCFGEINEPTSRAIWENFDSDDENEHKLEWSKKWTQPERISALIISEGPSATEYVETCILTNATCLNEIKSLKLKLFQVSNSDVLVCVSPSENVTAAGDVTVMLDPILCVSKKIIILKSSSIAEYSSLNINTGKSCIIRALHTDKSKNLPPVPLLEQPNIVSGISAGVLCLMQHLGLPASLYICFTDNPTMDSTIALQITALLRKLDISVKTDYRPKIITSSNLYM